MLYNIYGVYSELQKTMQIQIVYKDDLPDEIKQLCEKYWLRKPGEDTKFVHNATDIMSESGLRFYEILEEF